LRISAAATDQYRALQEQAGILVREDRGRIVLRGADRKAYLQGLLSNDITALRQDDWCYATLLTAQGRMISDMRVFDVGEAILMDLARPVTSPVAEHLDKFVITEDVSVEDVTEKWGQIGVYGPHADAMVAAVTSVEPGLVTHALPSDDIGVAGVDLIVERANVPRAVAALERAGALQVDESTAEVTRIEAGIPKFLVDMDTHTIPLEAGIEDRAISMSKGCYVGQEVIVRVLHRGGGRVAKKLVSLTIDGQAERDDLLFAGEREVGRITSAADSPAAGKRIALGYVHRDYVEPRTELEVRTATGRARAEVSGTRVG
jgi:tRNA-modifying protein YgfZ